MAHFHQQVFCLRAMYAYPECFRNRRVLDIGSLDINGNNRFLFRDCEYVGIDVAEGRNVDVVSIAHLYDAPAGSFGTVISTEVFEHDMYYPQTVQNVVRLLEPGGAFIFTCAAPDRPEHGTQRSDGSMAAPLLLKVNPDWANYYRNLTKEDFLAIEGFRESFSQCHFEYDAEVGDLYFMGFKRF
jgi:SAM-dependent methyltransferase